MVETGSPSPQETLVGRARNGNLFNTETGEALSEAQAAEILRELTSQIQSGKLRPDQAASWIKDYHPELGDRTANLEQARITGDQVEDKNRQETDKRLVALASQSVGLAIVRAEIGRDANSIKTHLDQVVPALSESMRSQLAESYAQLHTKFKNVCDSAPSFESLLSELKLMQLVRFSPTLDNIGTLNQLEEQLNISRQTDTQVGSLQSNLIKTKIIPLTYPLSPLLTAVQRLEATDPQIQAARGGARSEVPEQPQKWLLSMSIQGEKGVRVETSAPQNTESVVLNTADGNAVSIPLERLKAAHLSWSESQASPKAGSAQDIDVFQLKYNSYSGEPAHLIIQGTDLQQNNALYYVSLTDEALTSMLRILDPSRQQGDEAAKPEADPATGRGSRGIIEKIRFGMQGMLGRKDIVQTEVPNFPEPGLHTLKSPHHFNQDRIGYGAISYDGFTGVRIVVNDGSGGSLSTSGLDQRQQDRLIGDKAAHGRDAVLSANQKPAEALQAAHKAVRLDNESYSTIMVADIVTDQQGEGWLKYAGLGDPAIVAYRKDQPFAHRRVDLRGVFVQNDTPTDERKRILGEPSHMQVLSMQHNVAVMEKISGTSAKTTGTLDSAYEANSIYCSFGDKDKADVHPNEYQIKLKDVGADFLLIMSDGAEPNAMIDSSPQRDMSQALAAVQGDSEREKAIKNQPAYSQEVHSIMSRLTDGQLTVEQASAKIAQAARDILGDTDDISVAIIDVRQFR